MSKPTLSDAERKRRSDTVKKTNAKMTPEERSAAGRKAIAARWADRDAPPANAAAIIEQAAANGCTRSVIAHALGVGRGKLREWLASPEHGPALQQAMASGKEVEHDRLVGFLMKAAHDGKSLKGSIVAILFLLKTRHGYQEGQTLVQNSVSINYQLPAPLSVDDYLKSVAPGAGLKQQVPANEVKKLLPAGEVKRA
jgi:hypothetical protein